MSERLARDGLAVGSIRRMVAYEHGRCPPNAELTRLVAEETKRRTREMKAAGSNSGTISSPVATDENNRAFIAQLWRRHPRIMQAHIAAGRAVATPVGLIG